MELTEQNYFSPEANAAFLSASQYKSFRSCEAAALAELRGEYTRPTTTALLVGSYVDAYFSGDSERFKAVHPEIFKRDGTLKAEYKQAETIIEKMESDRLYSLLMSGKKQVVVCGEIAGIPFKAKIDSLLFAGTVERIAADFPETADIFAFSDGAIVDQKVMRDMEDVWDPEERRKVSFIEAWGYDIQGAIYQRLVGGQLPFILAVGTKQDPPDLAAIHIPDAVLQTALREVEDNAPRFQRIKMGQEAPTRCGKCAYCRATRRLVGIETYSETDLF